MSKEFLSIMKTERTKPQPENTQNDIPDELNGCFKVWLNYYNVIPQSAKIFFIRSMMNHAGELVDKLTTTTTTSSSSSLNAKPPF